jgi:hypothetical protein
MTDPVQISELPVVWVLWTEGGSPLGVYETPKRAKIGAPLGMQWEYIRGRISFWRGECGGFDAGCPLHDMAIHHTWYIQRFEVKP